MHVLSLAPLLTLLSTTLSSPVILPETQTALYSSDTPFLADLSVEDAFSTPAFFFDTVSPALFDDFVRYTKYSSAAYLLLCRKPLGNTLVYSVRLLLNVSSNLFIASLVFRWRTRLHRTRRHSQRDHSDLPRNPYPGRRPHWYVITRLTSSPSSSLFLPRPHRLYGSSPITRHAQSPRRQRPSRVLEIVQLRRGRRPGRSRSRAPKIPDLHHHRYR